MGLHQEPMKVNISVNIFQIRKDKTIVSVYQTKNFKSTLKFENQKETYQPKSKSQSEGLNVKHLYIIQKNETENQSDYNFM